MKFLKLPHIVILITLSSVTVQAQTILDISVSIDVKEQKFDVLINEISELTGVHFSYNANLFNANQRFTVKKDEATVREVLNFLLLGTNISFGEFKGQVIFYKKKVEANAKYHLGGVLIDSISNERIHQAHIYLNGTDIGTYSDIDGKFELKDISEGTYELIVSHVTYGVHNYILNISRHVPDLQIVIAPRINFLKEVQVISETNPIFLAYYRIFQAEILGSTENASECVINNPEDILIENKGESFVGDFEVYTSNPISITNHALGYEVLYDLIFFEASESQNLYVGKVSFTKMTPKNIKEAKKWQKNRVRAYNGSLRDFVDNASGSKRSNFRKSVVDGLPDLVRFKYLPLDAKSEEISKLVGISEELEEGKYLKVVHRKSGNSSYLAKIDFDLGESAKYDEIQDFFDRKSGVAIYGNWAQKRLADTLPFNFLETEEISRKKLRETNN